MHILYPHDLGREEREEEREGGKGREEREKREKEKEQEEYIYNSYRGEDLGYPPQSIFPPKIHSVLTLFGIITTKYVYFTRMHNLLDEVCWQGYAYALKSATELI